jgi:hypothetical protein
MIQKMNSVTNTRLTKLLKKSVATLSLTFMCIITLFLGLQTGIQSTSAATSDIFTPKCTPENCIFTFLAPISFFNQVPYAPGTFNVSKGGATSYLKQLYIFGIAIASALAVLMITLGGVQYSTTDAIEDKKDGKDKIKSALIGLLLALLSYTILNTINPYLVKGDFAPPPIKPDPGIGNRAPEGTPAVLLVPGGGSAEASGTVNPNIPNTRQGPVLYNGHVTEMMRGLSSTGRSSDGRLTFTVYGYDGDFTPDRNSNILRIGNRNNPLLPGSVALSRDIIAQYKPRLGASVFINGTHVGYFDDTVGPGSVNTIDFFDPNKELGGNNFMRNIPSGQWNITFGPNR